MGFTTSATLPALMTQRDAAEYLCKSVKWLERDRWIGGSNPEIPYVKIGRSVRYRADDLRAYVEAHRTGGGT